MNTYRVIIKDNRDSRLYLDKVYEIPLMPEEASSESVLEALITTENFQSDLILRGIDIENHLNQPTTEIDIFIEKPLDKVNQTTKQWFISELEKELIYYQLDVDDIIELIHEKLVKIGLTPDKLSTKLKEYLLDYITLTYKSPKQRIKNLGS